jgi:Ca2+:H+ antiporter
VLEVTRSEPLLTFVFATIALIPLAKLIGDSTEHLATHYGTSTASLLNVTFGNAAEIIIATVALSAGLVTLVKASIIGAIIGNLLLIFGLSLFVSGLKKKEQFFNKENTGHQGSMLFLAIIGLAIPTMLAANLLRPTTGVSLAEIHSNINIISDVLAAVLLGVYIASIIFTFVTHKHIFAIPSIEMEGEKRQKTTSGDDKIYKEIEQGRSSDRHDFGWSKKKCILLLGASVIGVVIVSEILVSSIEVAIKDFGVSEIFVGAIIVGIIGNAAEHSSAITFARKGKLDLSIGIAAGSGTQIAIFVVPILVIAGILLHQPFSLVFTIYELAVIFLGAIIVNLIAHDGKSNWFEGLMLTAVYAMIAVGFFFIK